MSLNWDRMASARAGVPFALAREVGDSGPAVPDFLRKTAGSLIALSRHPPRNGKAPKIKSDDPERVVSGVR